MTAPMLPCPFCGTPDPVLRTAEARRLQGTVRVECEACGGAGPDLAYNGRDDLGRAQAMAIAAWNVRA